MRKLIVLAAALVLPMTAPAMAGLKEDARAQCVVISTAGIPAAAGATPEETAQMSKAIDAWCGCFTDQVAALGADGEVGLTVLLHTTPEQAMAGAADPVKDKEITIGIAQSEAGLSQADAEAWYARFEPQVKAISQSCVASATP